MSDNNQDCVPAIQGQFENGIRLISTKISYSQETPEFWPEKFENSKICKRNLNLHNLKTASCEHRKTEHFARLSNEVG